MFSNTLAAFAAIETEKVRFVLFEKLSEVSGIDLILLISAIVIALILTAIVIVGNKKKKAETAQDSGSLYSPLFAIVIFLLAFSLCYSISMVVTATSALLVTSGEVGIADIFAFDFTARQFSGRLVLALFVGAIFCSLYCFLTLRGGKLEQNTAPERRIKPQKALVFGGLSLALAFVLSYLKLFSMPFGGSITLCSMLPIMLYSIWAGPAYGFTVAFTYGVLQIVQGAYIVHWIQLILDYFMAFTILGVAGCFKKRPAIGIFIAGLSRMLCSTVSGAVFFGAYTAGFSNTWIYSLAYNGATIGLEVILCLIVYALPPVKKLFTALEKQLKA